TKEEIEAVEALVNEEIAKNSPVVTEVMNVEEAKKTGAMALFGEKYEEDVRVVTMGDFSKELCGGTHVRNTGLITTFKIVSESGVAAGVRRIEALTGDGVFAYYKAQEQKLAEAAKLLKATPENLSEKISHLLAETKALHSEIESLKSKAAQEAVWSDGAWKFLGACEPEEILNKGWFTNASSRAMMVHSRWLLPTKPQEGLVGRRGMSLVINQLKTYAETTHLEVMVVNSDGTPAPGAEIRFEVLNYAGFGEIACVHADAEGKKTLETGFGTVQVTAYQDGAYAEMIVDTANQKSCMLKL
ncbi:alanine--tRNA ligase, partial [gut metagenome]